MNVQATLSPVEQFAVEVLPPERRSALFRGLPSHIKPERFERNLVNALMANPALIKYDPRLVYREVSKAAALGLYLDPQLGEAYIIEAWNSRSKTVEPQLRVGYRGVAKLARQSGEIAQLYSHEVCQFDKILCRLGDTKELLHEPDLFGNRGQIVGYYAVAIFSDDNGKDFEPMTVAQIHSIRDRSDAWKAFQEGKIKSTPWSTDESEMARKTVMKRLLKRLPQSPELADAIRLEDEAEQVVDMPRLAAPRLPPAAPKAIERVDQTTGEITEVKDTSAVAPQSAAGRKRGPAAARSAPSTDVRDARLDSSAVAHQGSRTSAAPSGSPTHEDAQKALTELIVDMVHASDVDELKRLAASAVAKWKTVWTEAEKKGVDEAYFNAFDRIERTPKADEYQMGPTPKRASSADKALMSYAKDLDTATDAEDAEVIRDGYMTQHGMAWSREQKEEAAKLYAEACERIDTANAHTGPVDAPAEDQPEDDSFPGDTPAPKATEEAPQEAPKPKRTRTPPKAPTPASEPVRPLTQADNGPEPTTAGHYADEFNRRYAAVKTVEQAKALKSWWFASATQRNLCNVADDDKNAMRNMWTERLLKLQGEA